MADDSQYLAKLRDYYARHRVLPSYASIGALVGLRSKASVAGMVTRFKVEGLLESSPDRRLKPGRHFFDRPVSGNVRAGAPSAAVEVGHDSISIDEHLIRHPSRTMLVTVKGDSMIDVGIFQGDVVVVEKGAAANIGAIVIAMLDNEFTLKRLDREKGRVVLRPENTAYPVIRLKGSDEIIGVVVGLFRKYR